MKYKDNYIGLMFTPYYTSPDGILIYKLIEFSENNKDIPIIGITKISNLITCINDELNYKIFAYHNVDKSKHFIYNICLLIN